MHNSREDSIILTRKEIKNLKRQLKRARPLGGRFLL